MNVAKRLKRKSWVKYAGSGGDLSVVVGSDRLYDRKIAREERARKRRQAALKAAKTRREKNEARVAAAMVDARNS